MRRRKLLTPMLALSSCLHAGMRATAATKYEYHNKAFDMTYETDVNAIHSTLRVVSDGQGKLVSILNAVGHTIRTIEDYRAKTSIGITTLDRTISITRLQPVPLSLRSADQKRGMTEIGAKIVAGHPCHGFRAAKNGSSRTIWIGDDTDCLVESTITSLLTRQTIHTLLTKWSATGPTKQDLEIPQNFKVVKGYVLDHSD